MREQSFDKLVAGSRDMCHREKRLGYHINLL